MSWTCLKVKPQPHVSSQATEHHHTNKQFHYLWLVSNKRDIDLQQSLNVLSYRCLFQSFKQPVWTCWNNKHANKRGIYPVHPVHDYVECKSLWLVFMFEHEIRMSVVSYPCSNSMWETSGMPLSPKKTKDTDGDRKGMFSSLQRRTHLFLSYTQSNDLLQYELY